MLREAFKDAGVAERLVTAGVALSRLTTPLQLLPLQPRRVPMCSAARRSSANTAPV